jgi:hypothetical protein
MPDSTSFHPGGGDSDVDSYKEKGMDAAGGSGVSPHVDLNTIGRIFRFCL